MSSKAHDSVRVQHHDAVFQSSHFEFSMCGLLSSAHACTHACAFLVFAVIQLVLLCPAVFLLLRWASANGMKSL